MSATPLRVGDWFVIPPDELRWHFDTSGGPGGQHANRSATRVELSWDLSSSPAVIEDVRRRLIERLDAPGGTVTVTAADTRSQWRNRALARRRLEETLLAALRVDAPRIATATPRAARRRRRDEKRRRSAVKRMRQRPEEEE